MSYTAFRLDGQGATFSSDALHGHGVDQVFQAWYYCVGELRRLEELRAEFDSAVYRS